MYEKKLRVYKQINDNPKTMYILKSLVQITQETTNVSRSCQKTRAPTRNSPSQSKKRDLPTFLSEKFMFFNNEATTALLSIMMPRTLGLAQVLCLLNFTKITPHFIQNPKSFKENGYYLSSKDYSPHLIQRPSTFQMIYSVGNPPIFELLQDVPNKNPTPIFNAPCQTFKMDNNGRLGFAPKQ